MILNKLFGLTIRTRVFNVVAGQPGLLKRLRELTLGEGSGMNYELDKFEKLAKVRQVNCKVFTAHRDNKIVAWAFSSKEPTDFFILYGGPHFYPKDGCLFQVYVDRNYRRQGIASKLIKLAKKKAGKKGLCVSAHNISSDNFFYKFKNYQADWVPPPIKNYN